MSKCSELAKLLMSQLRLTLKPEAEEECQRLADRYNVELEGTERRGKNWFDCLFRGI